MADAGNGEYWYVIYKAIGDFSDLIKDAALARTAMNDVAKAAKAEGDAEAAAATKAATARQADIDKIKEERRELESLAAAAKLANVQTLYGGRSSMEQHLGDMSQELNYQNLLNRATWLGFTTPQQAYAWRQQEYNQRLLMNRAEWGGYATPDQYIGYLQRDRAAMDQLNTVMRARSGLYKDNTDAALAYANALAGTHASAATLGEGLSGIQQYQNALVGLPDVVSTTMSVDDSAAIAELARYQAMLHGLPNTVSTTEIVTAAQQAGGVPLSSTIPVSLGGPYESQLHGLVNELVHLSRDRVEIPVSLGLPDTEQVQDFTSHLPTMGPTSMVGGTNVSAGPPAAAAHAFEDLAHSEDDAGAAARGAAAPITALGSATLGAGASASIGRGWWRLLSKEVQLFGGILPGVLGHIALWHVLLDGVIETLAVLIPAAVALTAWAYAALPALEGVGEHLYSVWIVSKALNTTIPPMTSNFKQFQDAVKPQVIQLYGDAIDVMNSKQGALGQAAVKTGTILDQLGARIAVALQSPSSGKFLDEATKDLSTLLDFFANIFGAVGNILKVMPGYAEKLLGILDEASKAIEAITGSQLGSWLIGIGLTFHGALVWGGLFATGILGILPVLAKLSGGFRDVETGAKLADDTVKDLHGFDRYKAAASSLVTNVGNIGGALATAGQAVAGFFPKMAALGGAAEDAGIGAKAAAAGTGLWKTALVGLAEVPVWGWVALGAVALTGLVFWLSRSKTATDEWVTSTDKAVASANNWQSIPTLFTAATQSQTKLDTATKQLTTSLDKSRQSTQGVVKDFQGMGTVAGSQSADIDKLAGAHDRYTGQLTTEISFIDKIAERYGVSYPQAVGLATAAGVKLNTLTNENSQAFKIALQQVEGLGDGYKDLGQAGAALGNDVDAVNLQMEIQSTQVSKLNSAWDDFIALVTGGEQSFIKFGQDMNTLSTAATTAGASMTGIDKASLALRVGFVGAVQDGNKLLDQLREQVTVTGSTEQATNQLSRAGKDLIATLLPMAAKSKDAQAQVFALAQSAGYGGVNSLKALTKWAGKEGATSAEQDLSDITGKLTGEVSNLTKDYENLATVLSSDVNQIMADSILKADKAQISFLDFAQGIKQGTTDSNNFKDAADKVIQVLLEQSNDNVPKAKAAFEAYMLQLGQTKDQADKLWTSLSGRVSVELANEAVKTVPQAKSAFVTFAKDGLKVSQTQADDLWSEITGKLGPQLDALTNKHTPAAKAAFVDWAMNGLHLTKTQAQDLWGELNTLQQRIDTLKGKNIQIIAEASGSGTIAITGTGWAAGSGNIRFHAAGGGMVPGGMPMYAAGGGTGMAGRVPGYNPGVDSFDAKVSPGEFILTPEAAAAFGYDKLDAWNRMHAMGRQSGTGFGYAGGGFVSLDNQLSPQIADQAGQFTGTDAGKAVFTGVQEAITAAKKKVTQKASAASAAAPPGAVSGAIGELPANWQTIAGYLASHGFTHAWAAGVGGNIFVESGGNPNIWEASGGGGYGLIQWTPPPPGLVGSGLIGELNQIVGEGTSFFNGAQTPSVAALEYLMNRERPANPAATAGTREASANAIFKAMGWSDGGRVPGFAGGGTMYPFGGAARFAAGGTAWNYPAPTGLHAYDITDKGFRLAWNPVKGPADQKPSGYTVETIQLNNKIVDEFVAKQTSTAEYGKGAAGLTPGWQYHTLVWANGGPKPPPHSTMLTSLQKPKTVAGLPAISTTAQDAYQTWFGDSQQLDRDVHAELAQMWQLNALTNVGKKNGPTKAQAASWKAELEVLQAQQKKVVGLGVKPPGYYDQIHGYFSHPQDLPPTLWSNFQTGVANLENWQAGPGHGGSVPPHSAWRSASPTPSPQMGWRFEPQRTASLHAQLQRLLADTKTLGSAWKGTFTGGTLTPGPKGMPTQQSIGQAGYNLQPLIQGGPSSPVFDMVPGASTSGYGFASGGLVGLDQVASMFAGVMPGGFLMPQYTPGGIPDALLRRLSSTAGNREEAPRRLSQAGAAHKAAFNVDSLTINNPVAEQPSQSIARVSNRLAFLAGRGVD